MGAKATQGIPFIGNIEAEHEFNLQQAKAVEADARYNAEQRRRQADKLTGQQIAAVGMSGVELSDSVAAMVEQDRVDAELEAMNIIYSGKAQAAERKFKSQMQRSGAYQDMVLSGAKFGGKQMGVLS